jgi:glyoxylate/hydroxypyruvate reductase A
MALLIDVGLPAWMTDQALHDVLAPLLPGVTIYCGRPAEDRPDVVMLATAELAADVVTKLPNLALVQKLGAGVEKILRDPDLPADVRVARLTPDIQAEEIAQYCLAYVLRDQRHMALHETSAAQGHWNPKPPRRNAETTVGVLGLGHIGGRAARLFASLGFRVLGWSRTPKSIDGADCRAGLDALPGLLSACDYVVSILPATPETRDLFDAELMGHMKPGAVLINAGRGDLIVEAALIDALDGGWLGGAVLDTFRQEPLPPGHPFWRHPRVTVTPHVSGWHVDGGLEDVAENYRRLADGRPLLHEVDRAAGY